MQTPEQHNTHSHTYTHKIIHFKICTASKESKGFKLLHPLMQGLKGASMLQKEMFFIFIFLLLYLYFLLTVIVSFALIFYPLLHSRSLSLVPWQLQNTSMCHTYNSADLSLFLSYFLTIYPHFLKLL